MSEDMLTSETEAALLRSVLSNPADDTVRLAIADYWEEAGRNERAEFCRVQVELSRELRCDHECQNRVDYKCPDCTRRTALRSRERELLSVGRHEWQGATAELIPKGAIIDDRITFTRGFISQVTCTAADWLQHHAAVFWHPKQTEECPECKGSFIRSVKCGLGHTHRVDCYCENGRIPRPCPATAQPIERVVLTTEPDLSDFGDWQYWSSGDGQRPEMFRFSRWPGIVFEVRPERERRPIHAHGARGWEEP